MLKGTGNWLVIALCAAAVVVAAYWRITWRIHLLHITAWEAFWL